MRRFAVLALVSACGGGGELGATADAPPDAEHHSGSGSINLRGFSSEPTGGGTVASAMFIAREDCGTMQIGPCSIRFCAPDWLGLMVSAGDLVVDSTPAFVIPPGAPDQTRSVSYFANTDRPAFGPGEARTLRAAGYAVPAFSVPFVAPEAAVITSPAPAAKLALGPGDFTLTWSGGSGFVDVLFDFFTGHAVCRFDAAAGTGVIPFDAIRASTITGSYFVIETSSEVKTMLTDWAITTTASIDATWSDGSAATGQVTLTSPPPPGP